MHVFSSNIWNGILIKRVYQFKYLGVTYDEHLSWNTRIGELVSKSSKRLGMLRRMGDNLTVCTANAVYIYIYIYTYIYIHIYIYIYI
jgi:hypothetical protein